MNTSKESLLPVPKRHNSSSTRLLLAKKFFQTVDDSLDPNPEIMVTTHERWLNDSLLEIGVDPNQNYLGNMFREKEMVDKSLKPRLGEIEVQARVSSNNILQAIGWFLAPEYTSKRNTTITLHNPNLFQDQDNIKANALKRLRQSSGNRHDWNSGGNKKPPFNLKVNEHYVGIDGKFDWTDSTRISTEVRGNFDLRHNLFSLTFDNWNGMIGWEMPESKGKPIYKLRYALELIGGFMSAFRSGNSDIIGITT